MKVHGSESSDVPVCARQGLTLNITHHPFPTFGFRLVHDDVLRVNRSGSWVDVPDDVRVDGRSASRPALRGGRLGFRLARREA